MEYNITFMVKYDKVAKNNIAPIFESYEWWLGLVSKVLKNTDEFEMRLWGDDLEGIQAGEKFGKKVPNNKTMEIVYQGNLTPELKQEMWLM